MKNDEMFLSLMKRAVATKFASASRESLLDLLANSMHRRCVLASAADAVVELLRIGEDVPEGMVELLHSAVTGAKLSW